MPNEKTTISGNTAMLLLQLLSEKDMYGYEMIETLRERSDSTFDMKAGTLYPLLHSMEVKNQVTTYETQVQNKIRKYYSITKAGRKALDEKKQEWEHYVNVVGRVMGGVSCANG